MPRRWRLEAIGRGGVGGGRGEKGNADAEAQRPTRKGEAVRGTREVEGDERGAHTRRRARTTHHPVRVRARHDTFALPLGNVTRWKDSCMSEGMRPTLDLSANLETFFHDVVDDAMRKKHVEATEAAEYYLLSLLTYY